MPTVTQGDPVTIDLQLKNDAYTVVVGSGLLDRSAELIQEKSDITSKKVAVVTDTNVAPLHGEKVTESLADTGYEVTEIEVPAGEHSKSMERVTDICRRMLQAGLDRKSFLVALGGGVIGDLAGFAAAIFQRGIPCVQMPTTIVSQVDSSVGGKTGVNTPEGKNLLGAFHQPKLVIADIDTLQTLPNREFNEGFAEIIKHAGIRQADLLELVENRDGIHHHLVELVTRNVAIKADVVEADERETTGTRALLNFGHTIGHGIEAAGGYGYFLHGEAISLGLVAAARMSVKYSTLPQADADRFIDTLRLYDLPTTLGDDVKTADILAAMKRDKKFEAGAIRFVLLDRLGSAHVSDAVTEAMIKEEIEALRG